MRLCDLVDEEVSLVGDGAVAVRQVTCDSRAVQPGALFAALAGWQRDGFAFVPEALARGAVALLGDERIRAYGGRVPVVVAPDPRRAYARMCARFFPQQPPVVVAVTGTNGKSSTVSFLAALWRACGIRAASLGTLGVDPPLEGPIPSLTSPDAALLHELLAQLARSSFTHIALEASSHGLDQRRLDGLRLQAAAWTQFGRDHLDYHRDLDSYFAAKARLFTDLLPADGLAVVNADSRRADEITALCARRGLRLLRYGRGEVELRMDRVRAHPEGLELDLCWEGNPLRVKLGLYGPFQASNLAAALLLARATAGLEREALLAALSGLRPPAGRMERIGRSGRGVWLFVDYAHTPDALDHALGALRAHFPRARIGVVFGCGGERDAGKRPLMGRVARRRADLVVVTDDNPRGEDPASIRRAVLRGTGAAGLEIGDRRAAICAAAARLGEGDVLLVAGKGHERGQLVGDRLLPFDDREVLRELCGGAEVMP